jgi:predicted permease
MRLLHKLRHLLGRRRRMRRLEEEMRTHIELLTEENVRRGLARDEARRQAHLAFGNVLATREESEEALGWPTFESLVHDLRIAARSLLRRPGFSVCLIAILGLGIGATAAIFTLVRGMLWEPLPVPAPGELYFAHDATRQRPFLFSAATVRRLDADPEWRGRVSAYTDNINLTLRRGDDPAEPFTGRLVNGGFFSALQLRAAHGRMLTPADDLADAPRAVAVISWSWWQRRLGGDPAAVGRPVRLNGVEVTIVGIAPAAFGGLEVGEAPDAWLPISLHAALRAQASAWSISKDQPPRLAEWGRLENVAWLRLMVRAGLGVPPPQPAVEAAWRPQLSAWVALMDDPAEREEISRNRPQLVPSPAGYSAVRNRFRTVGLTLSLLVGAVVLVTAANSSTLLLLRQLARSRELGVRLALGAGAGRLARAAVMEGLLLSMCGAVAGGVIGVWLTPVLAGWLIPGAADTLPAPDGTLLLALGGLALVLGVVLGAAPAWLSAHLAPQSILQQRAALTGGSLRLGRALIVVQLALSVVLVSVALTLARDLRHALRSELGYARQSVITAFFDLAGSGIPPERQAAVAARIKRTAEALSGVNAVGLAASGALSGSFSNSAVYFRDRVANQPKDALQTESIDEGYFAAMGMTLLRGRGISVEDRDQRPHVAVISQALARRVFGDADPIGRRFGFGPNADEDDWEIVGLVADARINGVREKPTPLLYLPLAQWHDRPHCLAIRVTGDATARRVTVQKQISAAEPSVMFTRWATIEERIAQWTRNDRAAVRLTTGFGVLATLLAGIGVFGALGHLVASRARDIAVRLAIGAEPGRVWREIVREALVLGAAGAALGWIAAALLPRWLGAWLMTGLHTDQLASGFAVVAGLAAAVVGGLLPARRAARIDPLKLLRAE